MKKRSRCIYLSLWMATSTLLLAAQAPDQNRHTLANSLQFSPQFPPLEAGNPGFVCDSTVTKDRLGHLIAKVIYEYDTNGNPTLLETYRWDTETHQWVAKSKSVYAYDNNGNKTLDEYYNWDTVTHQWAGIFKFVYSYDTNANKTLDESYDWDTTTHQWRGNSKFIATYDNNGKNILYETYSWDAATHQWVNSHKTITAYDSHGNKTLEEIYRWNTTTHQWVYERKFIATYNTNGKQTLIEIYYWDRATHQWVGGEYKNVYAYDANGLITLSEDYVWDIATSSWILFSTTVYYHSAISPAVDETTADSKVMVYSPMANRLVIESLAVGEYALYYINGGLLQQGKLIVGALEISLSKGVYLLHTSWGNRVVVVP